MRPRGYLGQSTRRRRQECERIGTIDVYFVEEALRMYSVAAGIGVGDFDVDTHLTRPDEAAPIAQGIFGATNVQLLLGAQACWIYAACCIHFVYGACMRRFAACMVYVCREYATRWI